ncbi:MAG: nitroreductase [Hyphomonas sp.]
MLASRPSQAVRTFLALRKSANKLFLRTPGPSPDELNELLGIAARVPDHRKLTPWRFIVFEGENRTSFGAELARIAGMKTDAEARDVVDAAGLFLRAPVVVAVISSPVEDGRTPVWEQELSAGAVCYNLLLAANASGWAGVWLSEWMAYDPDVAGVLGLASGERVAGFVYLGTSTAPPQERIRPDLTPIVRRWPADGA